jgi:hypothetical protein
LVNAARPRESGAANEPGEDFLFHLYRGIELLQDNRVHEAKDELEHALTLQPRDPKGQDLLAVVYFRIGLYSRAIQIYEELKRVGPREAALRINLSLCYLKTGQPLPAKKELEDVVSWNPTHKRAWGYLGLALERLGEYEKAKAAFERGGHTVMARRLAEQLGALPESREGREVRNAAAMAFEELDAGELKFALAEPMSLSQGAVAPGTWKTIELGKPGRRSEPPPPPSSLHRTGPPTRHPLPIGMPESAQPGGAPPPTRSPSARAASAPPASITPRTIETLIKTAALEFPAPPEKVVLRDGLALVQLTVDAPFAARLEAVRSYSGALTTSVLERQARGKSTGDAFGGVGAPVVKLAGDARLVLAPRRTFRIHGLRTESEPLYVREELVLGFDLGATYENGRVAFGEGDAAQIVQIRGGVVLLESMHALASLACSASQNVVARRDAVIGWVGRLVPRALPMSEAPFGQHGLLSLSGDGALLLACE